MVAYIYFLRQKKMASENKSQNTELPKFWKGFQNHQHKLVHCQDTTLTLHANETKIAIGVQIFYLPFFQYLASWLDVIISFPQFGVWIGFCGNKQPIATQKVRPEKYPNEKLFTLKYSVPLKAMQANPEKEKVAVGHWTGQRILCGAPVSRDINDILNSKKILWKHWRT